MDTQTRKKIPYEEVDTSVLHQALSHYASPGDKVRDMVRRGEIVRLRRGLYAISPEHRNAPISLEVLANTLYGPSYLSLEYALSYYGLIPERAPELTSVCLGRSRRFETPVGNFSYCSIKKTAYVDGFDLRSLSDGRSYLMATPEKALVDWTENRRLAIFSEKEMADRLLEDMRMNEEDLSELNLQQVERFANRYGSGRTRLLAKFLKKLTGVKR